MNGMVRTTVSNGNCNVPTVQKSHFKLLSCGMVWQLGYFIRSVDLFPCLSNNIFYSESHRTMNLNESIKLNSNFNSDKQWVNNNGSNKKQKHNKRQINTMNRHYNNLSLVLCFRTSSQSISCGENHKHTPRPTETGSWAILCSASAGTLHRSSSC